jgi:hypothetical protein
MKILLSENLSKRQSGALSFTNVRPSVQKMFVKDFTASTGQNDLIFGIELQHDEFYIYIYILRQSVNGDDYLSGAAQREQTKKL